MADHQYRDQIAALRAAGFTDAANLLASLPTGAQKQPTIGQPAPGQEQPVDAAAQQFKAQIESAQAKGGGWQSTPITAPIPRDPGRF